MGPFEKKTQSPGELANHPLTQDPHPKGLYKDPQRTGYLNTAQEGGLLHFGDSSWRAMFGLKPTLGPRMSG